MTSVAKEKTGNYIYTVYPVEEALLHHFIKLDKKQKTYKPLIKIIIKNHTKVLPLHSLIKPI